MFAQMLVQLCPTSNSSVLELKVNPSIFCVKKLKVEQYERVSCQWAGLSLLLMKNEHQHHKKYYCYTLLSMGSDFQNLNLCTIIQDNFPSIFFQLTIILFLISLPMFHVLLNIKNGNTCSRNCIKKTIKGKPPQN